MKRVQRVAIGLLGCAAVLATAHAGAGERQAVQALDACTLLTSEEIARVQGEPVKAAKGSGMPNPQFTMAQCFYTLGSSSKGVSLSVAVPSAERPAAPREFWVDRFQKERERGKRARAAAGREPEEDGEPVVDLGDEAFWVGDVRIGSLYVLEGGRFFRISLGGVTDPGERRERSIALARAVLKRLPS